MGIESQKLIQKKIKIRTIWRLFFFSKILRLSKNCTLMEFILIYLIFIYIRPVPFEHKTIFILFKIFLHMCVSFPTSIPFNLYSFHSIFKILCFQFYTQIPQRSHSFPEFHYIFPTLASYINAWITPYISANIPFSIYEISIHFPDFASYINAYIISLHR